MECESPQNRVPHLCHAFVFVAKVGYFVPIALYVLSPL